MLLFMLDGTDASLAKQTQVTNATANNAKSVFSITFFTSLIFEIYKLSFIQSKRLYLSFQPKILFAIFYHRRLRNQTTSRVLSSQNRNVVLLPK